MNNSGLADLSRLKRRFAAVFITVAAVLIAGGVVYHRQHQAELRSNAERLLLSIEEVKLGQLKGWREDRQNDTLSLLDSPILSVYLRRLAADQGDKEALNLLNKRLQAYLKHNPYTFAAIAEAGGKVLISAGKDREETCPEIRSLIARAAASGRPELGKFYLPPGETSPHLDLAALAAKAPGGRAIFLLLRIDPADFLYPLLQSWSAKGDTGEVLLVGRDGDELVFLNDLRHVKGAALKLRFPITKSGLPAAIALKGHSGIIKGLDYRGVEVLAAVSPVPGTEWAIVTKMDWAEVMRGTGTIAALLVLVIMSLLAAAGTGAFLLFRMQAEAYRGAVTAAESRLSHSEDRFRLFFENSPLGKSITGLDGSIHVNKAFCDMLGYTKEELLGKKWQDLTPPEDVQRTEAIVRTLVEGKRESVRFEKRYLRKDGEVVHAEVISAVQRDGGGRPAYLITTVNDITARLEAEKLVKSEKERAQSYLELVGVVLLTLEKDQSISLVNRKCCEVLGYAREELIGKNWFDLAIPAEQRKVVKDVFDKLICGTLAPVEHFENEVVTKKGERRTLAWTNTVRRDSEGNIVGLLTSGEDITERKNAEATLRENEAFIRAVMDNLPIGISVNSVEPAVKFQYINDLFPDIYRTTREALSGPGDFWDSVYEDPVFREEIKKRVLADCASGDPEKMVWQDVPIVRNGETGYVTARNIPLPEKNLMISMVEDVTARKLSELEKDRLNALLLEKNREMENFLYITTHDLRSPLVNIQGFSQNLQGYFGEIKEILAEVSAPAPVKENLARLISEKIPAALEFVLSGSRKMDALISALLKVSRAGRVEMKPEKIEMGGLLKKVLDAMRFQLEEAGAEVKVGALPPCKADPEALNQVFSNLLDNALKYRDESRRLAVAVDGERTGDNVRYRISDNGPGIPKKDLERIWNVFYSHERTVQKKGEGIGLPMVRRLVEKNGGSIRAESKEGQGTAFYIELPAAGEGK